MNTRFDTDIIFLNEYLFTIMFEYNISIKSTKHIVQYFFFERAYLYLRIQYAIVCHVPTIGRYSVKNIH